MRKAETKQEIKVRRGKKIRKAPRVTGIWENPAQGRCWRPHKASLNDRDDADSLRDFALLTVLYYV